MGCFESVQTGKIRKSDTCILLHGIKGLRPCLTPTSQGSACAEPMLMYGNKRL